MAGGTGGHVFPALAVAEQLRSQGVEIRWLGTRRGLESRVVPAAHIPLDVIAIRGLRGKGLLGWLRLPFRFSGALLQSLLVIMRFRPMAVLGMGGFVSGPGALMSWLLRIPLLIHEQNAVAGMTNRFLSRLAQCTMTAFPGTLPARSKVLLTGNPVRSEIASLAPPEQRFAARHGVLHLLVLGGSQGARALNEALPGAVAALPAAFRPLIRHQSGRQQAGTVQQAYQTAGLQAEVMPFIEDMAAAYAWADLVVCRAGALTVAELAAAGVGAILIPYPHAVDDHQTRNADYLVAAGAARLLPQSERLGQQLAAMLTDLLAPGAAEDSELQSVRYRLLTMAREGRCLAQPTAAQQVAQRCLEAAHGD